MLALNKTQVYIYFYKDVDAEACYTVHLGFLSPSSAFFI